MYNTLEHSSPLIRAVIALLRILIPHPPVAALFTIMAAAREKAVIVLWRTTAKLRDPHCSVNCPHNLFQAPTAGKKLLDKCHGRVAAYSSIVDTPH